ncbi:MULTISPECIES: hypothetical protein [unclassified Pedobacter]|nr:MULTISPECIES: hypothetical protein [unclassified Pedobacter]
MAKSKVLLGSGKTELWMVAREARMDTEDSPCAVISRANLLYKNQYE